MGALLEHSRVLSRAARRFVAGETLDEMSAVARQLQAGRLLATVDHLGEAFRNGQQAREAAQECCAAASGHAMLGSTLAPSTAAAIADLICTGRSRYDVSAFDPARSERGI